MSTSLLLEGGESTYNTPIDVVQESRTLTATSQQYWAQRQARVKTEIDSIQARKLQANGEIEWVKFRKTGLTFINRLLWRFFDRLEKPLRAYWDNNKVLAKDGARLYRAGASVELLIPISTEPFRVVRITEESEEHSIRTEPFLNVPSETYLGKAFIAVLWQGDYSFIVWPNWDYSTVRTFYVDHPSLGRWDADPVLQQVFTDVAKTFVSELKAVSTAFFPLYESHTKGIELETHTRSLQVMKDASKVWDALHIPGPQKVEILHALELFECGDPASPQGLLLTGPPGAGKSMLGRTIAETVGCGFQHLTPASLKMDHLGGSGQRVRAVWEKARQERGSARPARSSGD